MTTVIAVDGLAASGKGTLCRSLCRIFGFDNLDTGLLYRGVAALVIDAGVSPEDESACTDIASDMPLDTLKRDGLRTESLGQVASKVSAIPGVRAALLDFQRSFAANPPSGKGAVLDGRDIGTVIFPNADLKLWLIADPEVRGQRRWKEMGGEGSGEDLDSIIASIRERDRREATRATAPMIPADDAFIIDTSALTVDEVLTIALTAAKERGIGK